MEKKSHYLSISALAKMRNITTETLRHYDRIGLITPDYKDEHGVRHYSADKAEMLGTIHELKQMGMSLKDIKAYFSDRSVDTSRALLEQYHTLIQARLRELTQLEQQIQGKIDAIDRITHLDVSPQIQIRQYPDRHFLLSEQTAENDQELNYIITELEGKVGAVESCLPIYATTRYAGLISQERLSQQNFRTEIAIQVDAAHLYHPVLLCPAGRYLCVYHRGSFWERKDPVCGILNYAREHGLSLDGPLIQAVLIDYTVTDRLEERLYEFQIRISENP